MQNTKQTYNEHCPACGKYVLRDADGFYDREKPDSESSRVLQFCDEICAKLYHLKIAVIEIGI